MPRGWEQETYLTEAVRREREREGPGKGWRYTMAGSQPSLSFHLIYTKKEDTFCTLWMLCGFPSCHFLLTSFCFTPSSLSRTLSFSLSKLCFLLSPAEMTVSHWSRVYVAKSSGLCGSIHSHPLNGCHVAKKRLFPSCNHYMFTDLVFHCKTCPGVFRHPQT